MEGGKLQASDVDNVLVFHLPHFSTEVVLIRFSLLRFKRIVFQKEFF